MKTERKELINKSAEAFAKVLKENMLTELKTYSITTFDIDKKTAKIRCKLERMTEKEYRIDFAYYMCEIVTTEMIKLGFKSIYKKVGDRYIIIVSK